VALPADLSDEPITAGGAAPGLDLTDEGGFEDGSDMNWRSLSIQIGNMHSGQRILRLYDVAA
jgi:hypothetical protein